MTPAARTAVYDIEVVRAFWNAHTRRETGPKGGRPGAVEINGYPVLAAGGNCARYFGKTYYRSTGVREARLEKRLHEFGFTLMDFEDWARDHNDGWNGRWIQKWERDTDH